MPSKDLSQPAPSPATCKAGLLSGGQKGARPPHPEGRLSCRIVGTEPLPSYTLPLRNPAAHNARQQGSLWTKENVVRHQRVRQAHRFSTKESILPQENKPGSRTGRLHVLLPGKLCCLQLNIYATLAHSRSTSLLCPQTPCHKASERIRST